jgi:tRNA pseudouridine38-40 synthase
MVRALVGSLIPVGEGRRPVGWPAEVMAGRTRHAGVTVVHPHGLTLEEVGYPDDDELAAQSERTRARREAIDA